jgi:hypothetical protein
MPQGDAGRKPRRIEKRAPLLGEKQEKKEEKAPSQGGARQRFTGLRAGPGAGTDERSQIGESRLGKSRSHYARKSGSYKGGLDWTVSG